MEAITFNTLIEYGARNLYFSTHSDDSKTGRTIREVAQARKDAAEQVLADFFLTADTSAYMPSDEIDPEAYGQAVSTYLVCAIAAQNEEAYSQLDAETEVLKKDDWAQAVVDDQDDGPGINGDTTYIITHGGLVDYILSNKKIYLAAQNAGDRKGMQTAMDRTSAASQLIIDFFYGGGKESEKELIPLLDGLPSATSEY